MAYQFDFAADGVGVGLVAVAGNYTRVEIAVRAFGLAERDLDVNAERHGGDKDCNAGLRAGES